MLESLMRLNFVWIQYQQNQDEFHFQIVVQHNELIDMVNNRKDIHHIDEINLLYELNRLAHRDDLRYELNKQMNQLILFPVNEWESLFDFVQKMDR